MKRFLDSKYRCPLTNLGGDTGFFENHSEQCIGVRIPLDVRGVENVARRVVLGVHARAPACRVGCTALSRFFLSWSLVL